jgi:formylglycine-generating enzyme required for sulfatase activity
MKIQAGWIPRLVLVAMIVVMTSKVLGVDLGVTGAAKGVKKTLEKKILETVNVPTAPSGPTTGSTGVSYAYSTGGSVSSVGHSIEYRFDWGDGTYSTWSGGASVSHSWTSAGTYSVKAQVRCATHVDKSAVSAGVTVTITALTSLAHQMVLIPAGTLQMGNATGHADEKPVHAVSLSAFYIDKYEVTFNQYDAFCIATGRTLPSDSGWGRGIRPVINVSWDDAKAYCDWKGKRLPTEAEWEYACQGGGTGNWCFGSTEATLANYAWYSINSGSMTHPVGEKTANAWGLHDMHGNVWEWCSDWYDGGYYALSPATNPQGPTSGTYRVLRVGSWSDIADDCRSARRYGYNPIYNSSNLGFRVAASQ